MILCAELSWNVPVPVRPAPAFLPLHQEHACFAVVTDSSAIGSFGVRTDATNEDDLAVADLQHYFVDAQPVRGDLTVDHGCAQPVCRFDHDRGRIAVDWIELKVGHFSGATNSPVPACYRVTNAGLRALRQGSTHYV